MRLEHNDNLNYGSPDTLLFCSICDCALPQLDAIWYEADLGFGSNSLVPVCPNCHAEPSSWLPAYYSVPGYLQSRDPERLPEGGY